MRLVFLDTGPLGLLTNTGANPKAGQCDRWARGLLSAGVRVFVPEIADYEQRRKLLHRKATAGIRRLDQLKNGFEYSPITTDVMVRAAELWAAVRSVGKPTAPPDALDGDAILAAQALLAVGPGDTVTVATDNIGHLSRYVHSQAWETITG